MNTKTTSDLISLTNSFNHKYLTIEESIEVITLNEQLLTLAKKIEKSTEKIIESFGGTKTDKGGYTGMTDLKGLNEKISELHEMEHDFEYNTKVISMDSLSKQMQVIDLNTIQIRTIKEFLVK